MIINLFVFIQGSIKVKHVRPKSQLEIKLKVKIIAITLLSPFEPKPAFHTSTLTSFFEKRVRGFCLKLWAPTVIRPKNSLVNSHPLFLTGPEQDMARRGI